MNEWILAGIAVVGTVLALGGGTWVVNSLSHRTAKKDEPKAPKA